MKTTIFITLSGLLLALHTTFCTPPTQPLENRRLSEEVSFEDMLRSLPVTEELYSSTPARTGFKQTIRPTRKQRLKNLFCCCNNQQD